jgi:hypothetical protein
MPSVRLVAQEVMGSRHATPNSCAKETIMDGGFETRVEFCRRDLRGTNRRSHLSKHDSVTKRKRRPKSDKRVDYTARTMAAIKQHSEAAKLSESRNVVPKSA